MERSSIDACLFSYVILVIAATPCKFRNDQKENAGNHSLRSCKPTVCNWIQFGDCQVWQVLIFGGGGGFGADKVRALSDNL